MSNSKSPKKLCLERRATYRVFDKSEIKNKTQLGEYQSLYGQFIESLEYLEENIDFNMDTPNTDKDKLLAVLAL